MKSLGGVTLVERPKSAQRDFLKQLFRDEVVAAVLSALSTAVVFLIAGAIWGTPEESAMTFVLIVLSGPVLEKFAFVAPYARTARGRMREEGIEGGWQFKVWFRYTIEQMKKERFWRVLRADLLVHDPVYTGLMAGLTLLLMPEGAIEAGTIAVGSFAFAVAIAAYLEVSFEQWRFKRLIGKLGQSCRAVERFGKIRLLVRGGSEPEKFIQSLRGGLHLGETVKRSYQDFDIPDVTLKKYNEWEGFMQIRSSGEEHELQLIYFRPRSIAASEEVFAEITYLEVIKATMELSEPTVEEALKALSSRGLQRIYSEELQTVTPLYEYERAYASHRHTVSVSCDRIRKDSDFEEVGIVELQFWPSALEAAAEGFQLASFHLHSLPTTRPRSLTPDMLAELPRVS